MSSECPDLSKASKLPEDEEEQKKVTLERSVDLDVRLL